MGKPKAIAIRLFAVEKCATRIRRYGGGQRAAATIPVKGWLAAPERGTPSADPATNHKNKLWTASRSGLGNKSARFFVHPSRSCFQLRYMRACTASPP